MFPTASELVAQFLRSNGYTETLAAFINEANLPIDCGGSSNTITIDQILQEKKTFDLSLNFEKLGVADKEREWQSVAPSNPITLPALPQSNILSVTQLNLTLASNPRLHSYLAATTADRRVLLVDASSSQPSIVRSYSSFPDSPILDLAVVQCRYLLAVSMSGKLLIYDTVTERVLDQRKDHGKYAVRLTTWSKDSFTFVATAGWDNKIFLYRLSTDRGDTPQLGEPVATLPLPTVPETLTFIRSAASSRPILLLTRRDSTFLHYYALSSIGSDTFEISLLGKQNLAPHSNAWVAFTPSDVQVSPVDASIVAVATSSTPHMKLLVVQLLLPPEEASSLAADQDPDSEPVTQASQARADRLLQDKEEAAIKINIGTMAPQTAYSTPRLAWRPDGSGIYVSSDDGVVRGFEANTGKRMITLEAHEPGSKIRCLCTGRINVGSEEQREEEYLLTGGFDQKLVLWRTG